MNPIYIKGQQVRLSSSQGEITRIVVEDLGEVITVCTKQEIEAAKEQYRQPLRIGFRKKDVIGRD